MVKKTLLVHTADFGLVVGYGKYLKAPFIFINWEQVYIQSSFSFWKLHP